MRSAAPATSALPPAHQVTSEDEAELFNACSRPSSVGKSLFFWLRRILALPPEERGERRPSNERLTQARRAPAEYVASSTDILMVDDERHASPATKQRRMSSSAQAAAPTATSVEALPPRKARTTPTPTPPTVVSSCKQQQQHGRLSPSLRTTGPPSASPPAPPPPAEKPGREVSTRNYVIGGLSFEVDVRYKIKSIVGKGAYGLVCAAEDLCPSPKEEVSPKAAESGAPPTPPPNGEEKAEKAGPAMVAVKKVIDPFHDHTDCKRLLREIRLLRCLRHPNVLHLTDIMPARSPSPEDWKDVYLVTRLFDTNLHRVIYSGHALTDAHIQYILWQVFRALRYLHKAGVVHRDLKPTNVLLNRDCELALADFGLARFMPHAHCCSRASSSYLSSAASADDLSAAAACTCTAAERSKSKGGQLTKYVVTRWYRAPELLVQNRQYDSKVDMWSTGCILAEVLGAKALFPGKDSLHQLRLVVERLGLPSDDELEIIQNAQAVSYIRNLRPKEHSASEPADAAQRFARLFPHASPLLLDLMARLLQFDPRKRPTAEEALAHPYLAAYRDAPEEGLPTPEVEMHFESESPSTDELRMLIWDEVLRYHPAAATDKRAPTTSSHPSSQPLRQGEAPHTAGMHV